jgi:hypothetical protein
VALGYFTAPGTAKQKNVFNYFGGSVGGPVIVPKLFDGRRHKLFFFTDWEDTLQAKAATLNTDVPTAAELNGDFSGLTSQGVASPIIYDPATSKVVKGKRVETPARGSCPSIQHPTARSASTTTASPRASTTPTSTTLIALTSTSPTMTTYGRSFRATARGAE